MVKRIRPTREERMIIEMWEMKKEVKMSKEGRRKFILNLRRMRELSKLAKKRKG